MAVWLAIVAGRPLLVESFTSDDGWLTLFTRRLDHRLAERLLADVHPVTIQLFDAASATICQAVNTDITSGRTTELRFRITSRDQEMRPLACAGCAAKLEHAELDAVLLCNGCGAMYDPDSFTSA